MGIMQPDGGDEHDPPPEPLLLDMLLELLPPPDELLLADTSPPLLLLLHPPVAVTPAPPPAATAAKPPAESTYRDHHRVSFIALSPALTIRTQHHGKAHPFAPACRLIRYSFFSSVATPSRIGVRLPMRKTSPASARVRPPAHSTSLPLLARTPAIALARAPPLRARPRLFLAVERVRY
jgi:hypothetical protein